MHLGIPTNASMRLPLSPPRPVYGRPVYAPPRPFFAPRPAYMPPPPPRRFEERRGRVFDLNRYRREQAVLQSQQGQLIAQQQQLLQQQQQAMTSPQLPAPQPSVSPGSPEADLRPAQDAMAPSEEAPPAHGGNHKLLIGLAVVGAVGVGAFVFMKKRKGGGSKRAAD